MPNIMKENNDFALTSRKNFFSHSPKLRRITESC